MMARKLFVQERPLLRSNALRWAALAVMLVAVLMPLFRAFTTSGDVSGAVAEAEADSRNSASSGMSLPAEMLFQDPRYFWNADVPVDLAAVSAAFAVLLSAGAAVAFGQQWAGQSVVPEILVRGSRRRVVLEKTAVGFVAFGCMALVALFVCLGGLWLVSMRTGGLVDADPWIPVVASIKGAFAIALVASISGLLAVIARNPSTVLAVLLGYFTLVEGGLRTVASMVNRLPSARLIEWVRSTEMAGDRWIDCGAPRCPSVYAGTSLLGVFPFGLVAAFACVLFVTLIALKRDIR